MLIAVKLIAFRIIPSYALFQVLKFYVSFHPSKIYFETLKIIFKYHGSHKIEIIERIFVSQDRNGQRILSQ